ncbi:MAG: SDR family NAD(P)-dependent oxidoreductase [Lachnospiraceae bacterium]|nr:SDR family NAD(P)-dependent oxidoreductase [Lachnospiraceae bacterium]
MNIVIITGASSGIGREFAMQMDAYFESIDEFWLVARNRGKLMPLAKSLKHNARIFAMDITDREKLSDLEDAVFRHKATVRMLINCAGYGIMGEFCEQDRSLELGMIRLNCEALTELTHRMVPFMREGSRIIQMASSAAFLPQPDFAVYAATKSYVLSFSRALGEELKRDGIYVTAVCPGPVDTPFFDIAEAGGSTLALKKYALVSPERVAALALKDSLRRRPVSVCSLPIKSLFLLTKLVPHSVILDVMDWMKRKGY